MFPRRNSKRFFDYESSSYLVPESVVTTTSINPTVQSSTALTSTITTATTTSVHPTSTKVSLHCEGNDTRDVQCRTDYISISRWRIYLLHLTDFTAVH